MRSIGRRKEVLLTYNNNKYQSDLVKPSEISLFLNEKGKAKRLEEQIFFTTETDTRVEDDYDYNSKGYLTEYDSPIFNNVGVTWQNGNMIKSEYKGGYTIWVDHKYTTAINRTYPDLNLYLYGMAASSEWKYLWADELGVRPYFYMGLCRRYVLRWRLFKL